jgi:hypothetical protein
VRRAERNWGEQRFLLLDLLFYILGEFRLQEE